MIEATTVGLIQETQCQWFEPRRLRSLLLTVDGTGSGIDADLLDGQHAAAFATSGHNHAATYVDVAGDTMTGSLTVNGAVSVDGTLTSTGKIEKAGVAGQYETLKLGGGGAGIANANYIAFYDQAGTQRQAYMGIGSTTTYNVTFAADLGDVVISAGNATVAVGKSGTTVIAQSSTTAAVPTLLMTQGDVSEEFIEFSGTVAAGNPLDTAALGAYYGKVRVSVNGTFKYIALYN